MHESGIGPWINFGREVGKLFCPMEIYLFIFFFEDDSQLRTKL